VGVALVGVRCQWSLVFMNALLEDCVDERDLQISVQCLIGYIPGRVSDGSENAVQVEVKFQKFRTLVLKISKLTLHLSC
jgi:hypothetical protein